VEGTSARCSASSDQVQASSSSGRGAIWRGAPRGCGSGRTPGGAVTFPEMRRSSRCGGARGAAHPPAAGGTSPAVGSRASVATMGARRWGLDRGGEGSARWRACETANHRVGAPFSTRRRRGRRGELGVVNSVRGRSRGSAGVRFFVFGP
jgi:hypothetical protein